MIHGNLKWLVWKEYRQHRLIVLGMLFLFGPSVLGFPDRGLRRVARRVATGSAYVPGGIRLASRFSAPAHLLSFYVSQIALLLIGGNTDRQRAYRPVGGVPVQPADFTAEEPGRQSPTGAADVRRDLAAECRCVLGHGVRVFAL